MWSYNIYKLILIYDQIIQVISDVGFYLHTL